MTCVASTPALMVHDGRKTMITRLRTDFIVHRESARPLLPEVGGYGIEAIHQGMCKFNSAEAPSFEPLSVRISSWVEEASEVLQHRIMEEQGKRAQDMNH